MHLLHNNLKPASCENAITLWLIAPSSVNLPFSADESSRCLFPGKEKRKSESWTNFQTKRERERANYNPYRQEQTRFTKVMGSGKNKKRFMQGSVTDKKMCWEEMTKNISCKVSCSTWRATWQSLYTAILILWSRWKLHSPGFLYN